MKPIGNVCAVKSVICHVSAIELIHCDVRTRIKELHLLRKCKAVDTIDISHLLSTALRRVVTFVGTLSPSALYSLARIKCALKLCLS